MPYSPDLLFTFTIKTCLGRAMRSLNRAYFQNETSITAVMGNAPFLDAAGAADIFAPATPRAHHLAITSRSSAGRRGRINGCSSTKVENRACRKARTARRGAEGHPADWARAAGLVRSTRAFLPPAHLRELRRRGSAGFTCSNHADWTKAYLKIISLNRSKPLTKNLSTWAVSHA